MHFGVEVREGEGEDCAESASVEVEGAEVEVFLGHWLLVGRSVGWWGWLVGRWARNCLQKRKSQIQSKLCRKEERKIYSQTRHTPSSPPLTKHTLSAPIAPLNTQSW